MIAGTGSGCGKTMVTLAVLRAMQRRNIPLAAFKCGPDYIDPMFHKAVLGIPSRNLDLFFISEREVRGQIVRSIPQNGLGVIEGVMGFYDGVSGIWRVKQVRLRYLLCVRRDSRFLWQLCFRGFVILRKTRCAV